MKVSFGKNALRELGVSQTFPRFNSVYQGTVEWRLETPPSGKPRPFATILRWNVKLQDDEKETTGRVLVVTRLGPGGVCPRRLRRCAGQSECQRAGGEARRRARPRLQVRSRQADRRRQGDPGPLHAAARLAISEKKMPATSAGIQGIKPDRLISFSRSRRRQPCRGSARRTAPRSGRRPYRPVRGRIPPRDRCRPMPIPPGFSARSGTGRGAPR